MADHLFDRASTATPTTLAIIASAFFCLCWSLTSVGATNLSPAYSHHAAAMGQEHEAVLRLVPPEEATHRAVQSGTWSRPSTWRNRKIPGVGARVVVPNGITVQIDRVLSATDLRWVRIDGALEFATDRDTALNAVTLVVGERGSLTIGSANARVAPNHRSTIVFADRGPRDRLNDPFDISGGLVALGSVRVYGAFVTSHVGAASALKPGQTVIDLSDAPHGWKTGDLVVIPGVNPFADEDEPVRLTGVDIDSQRIAVDRPLRFAHAAPQPAQIRLANLTRNVTFTSANSSLDRRGHVMFMHLQSGVVIDSAGFYGLGRTDTRIAHTIPALNEHRTLLEGSDANTIGRYPIHFHIRSGARVDRSPHVVSNSAIVDSPKHGVVNHGGHVIAQQNVTFGVDGSHFFAENGREIGEFRDNIAIRSRGSELSHAEDAVITRMYLYDYGHGGYGYWVQGGGVRVTGNHAYGHQGAGYSVVGQIMRENAQFIFFDPANLRDPRIEKTAEIHPGDLPFDFSGNQAAGCYKGMEIWYSQTHSTHGVPSRVADSFFWGLAHHGIDFPYSRNIVFQNVTVLGAGTSPTSVGFGHANEFSDAMVFERVRAEGFWQGIDLPAKGYARVADSYLDNQINIRIRSSPGSDLDVDLNDVRFGSHGATDVLMQGIPEFTPALIANLGGNDIVAKNGDLSPFFGRVRVIQRDSATKSERQIYFPEQAAAAIPLRGAGIAALEGKTSSQIWQEFAIAVGGALAPERSTVTPRVIGLVGPRIDYPESFDLVSDRFTKASTGYVPRVRGADGRELEGAAVTLNPGWNVVRWHPAHPAVLVYADVVLPELAVDSGFRYEIHPADLPFGITVRGYVLKKIGVVQAGHLIAEHVTGLSPEPDGFVRFELPISDAVGNTRKVPFAIRVTESAVRRGRNSVYYLQGPAFPAAVPERPASEGLRTALTQ